MNHSPTLLLGAVYQWTAWQRQSLDHMDYGGWEALGRMTVMLDAFAGLEDLPDTATMLDTMDDWIANQRRRALAGGMPKEWEAGMTRVLDALSALLGEAEAE